MLAIVASLTALAAAGWYARHRSADTGADAPAPPVAAPSVTFNEHIAPILFANCSRCHRPGESGPFSLLDSMS